MARTERDTLKQLGDGVIKNLNTAGMKLGNMHVLYDECEKKYDVNYTAQKEHVAQMIDIVKAALDAAKQMRRCI